MPPKNARSKVDLRELARSHGIRFEGPAPPSQWPDQYKHQFQVIRNIDAIRYDDYKSNQQIPKKQRKMFRKEVKYLREKVYGLLEDVDPNESMWRDLELHIMSIFDRPVICGKCYNELWKPDFEADALREEMRAELSIKRLRRKECDCGKRQSFAKALNNDDENREIFHSAKEKTISHLPEDDLQSASIPMKPDRVIGLKAPSNIPWNEVYFPVNRQRVLLPFLIVEAKKGHGAPGFPAIQHQTAFPIRRCLKAQMDLLDNDRSTEPPIVWFLAYQGEEWRLYAGTHHNDKVRLFELWQGTIQSQDGALQLLLIVDYVWSWARDVFRPSVRKFILSSIKGNRDLSPVSTDRLRASKSISSAPSPDTEMYDRNWPQPDEMMVDTYHFDDLHIIHEDNQDHNQQATTIIEGQNESELLERKFASDFGSVRHSNVVRFEFRYLMPSDRFEQADPTDSYTFATLLSSAFRISWEQLESIQTLWSKESISPPEPGSRPVIVTIFFQTYCDKSNWEIKRVLNCILWRKEPHFAGSDGLSQHIEMDKLKNTILDVQQIHGRDSVWYALQNLSMLLLPTDPRPEWMSFDELNATDRVSGLLMTLNENTANERTGMAMMACGSALAQVNADFDMRLRSTLPNLEEDGREGRSMLAVRSPSWPASCPKFCLFVLLDAQYNGHGISALLEEAKELKNFYASERFHFNPSDWQRLRDWSKALRNSQFIS